MLDMFDSTEGERRKADAMQRVDEHADPDWKTAALSAVVYVAQRRAEFTTDAVWAVLDARGVLAPHEPRAMGPVMKRAVSYSFAVPTGRWSLSMRPQCNRRPIAVYRSLIHKVQAA